MTRLFARTTFLTTALLVAGVGVDGACARQQTDFGGDDLSSLLDEAA